MVQSEFVMPWITVVRDGAHNELLSWVPPQTL
jgi:hypothetical protein